MDAQEGNISCQRHKALPQQDKVLGPPSDSTILCHGGFFLFTLEKFI